MALSFIKMTLLLAQIPSVSGLESSGWYWRWGALLGLSALVCIPCFKDPKRSHDN